MRKGSSLQFRVITGFGRLLSRKQPLPRGRFYDRRLFRFAYNSDAAIEFASPNHNTFACLTQATLGPTFGPLPPPPANRWIPIGNIPPNHYVPAPFADYSCPPLRLRSPRPLCSILTIHPCLTRLNAILFDGSCKNFHTACRS